MSNLEKILTTVDSIKIYRNDEDGDYIAEFEWYVKEGDIFRKLFSFEKEKNLNVLFKGVLENLNE